MKLLSAWEARRTNTGKRRDRQTVIVDAFRGVVDAALTPSLAAPRADSSSSGLTAPIRSASVRCRTKFVRSVRLSAQSRQYKPPLNSKFRVISPIDPRWNPWRSPASGMSARNPPRNERETTSWAGHVIWSEIVVGVVAGLVAVHFWRKGLQGLRRV